MTQIHQGARAFRNAEMGKAINFANATVKAKVNDKQDNVAQGTNQGSRISATALPQESESSMDELSADFRVIGKSAPKRPEQAQRRTHQFISISVGASLAAGSQERDIRRERSGPL